jgi:DNA invertase Pin-like site-specific DNA recombinase
VISLGSYLAVIMQGYGFSRPATWASSPRKDRQMQGLALAKRNGIKFGRKTALSCDQVAEMRSLRSDGIKIVDLMTRFKVSKASVYRALSSS